MSSGAGRLLCGRYRLIGSLGDGGMGSVWQAYDTRLERTVAVKELASDQAVEQDRDRQRERVRHEALALAKVEHPVIVTIHDLLYEGRDGDPWIVMAFVRGTPLDRIIDPGPPLDEREAARIGLAVVHGLMACHERGIYHRDVKPANIIRCEDGSVRLVDFGIARIAGQHPLTAGHRVVGTLDFLAPELLNGEPAGPATDLWALGVTLCYALSGRPPFAGGNVSATIAAIIGKDPQPPGSGPLAGFARRMLAKEPASRPDAATVARVLRGIALGRPAAEPPLPAGLAPAGDQALVAAGPAPAQRTPSGPVRARTPLAGLTVTDAVRAVSDPANATAAADLLGLDRERAATIINRCPDQAAGRLLSEVATGQPAEAWRLLDMIPPDRAGRLLGHMSSLGCAAVLAAAPPRVALGLLARTDELTVVSALPEMAPASAASLVTGMSDDERVAQLLLATANPVTVAGILRHVGPADRGRSLLARLPAEFRALVVRFAAAPAAPAGR